MSLSDIHNLFLKVINKKYYKIVDYIESIMYFPQVINNVFSTYQQVCDVKLAFIGAQNYDCVSNSGRRTYGLTNHSITKVSASFNKLLITHNAYILT